MRKLIPWRPAFLGIEVQILASLLGGHSPCAALESPSVPSGTGATSPVVPGPGIPELAVGAGTFEAGSNTGEWDERPAHQVTIGGRFAMAIRPVSNAEFEAYAPGHRALRREQAGRLGDDTPATMMTWDEANGYCAWLSRATGKKYRLPTEAEWEYCFTQSGAQLTAGDNIENWCSDWYGPYSGAATTNPAGWSAGDFRVTRGGTWRPAGKDKPGPAYIRSRQGALPGEQCAAIGLRLLRLLDDGPALPASELTGRTTPVWAKNVGQAVWNWSNASEKTNGVPIPTFDAPRPFVKVPPGSNGPLFNQENHDPALVACPNGDLLAIWYSTGDEKGRELAVAGARLRAGQSEWDVADVFWDTPGRNDHAPGLLCDGNGRLYHFNGIAAEGGWKNLALTMRTSDDNGATWSSARFIDAGHRTGNQVVASPFQSVDGGLYVPCDENPSGKGGTLLHVSHDGGATWTTLNRRAKRPAFAAGGTGPWIAGIHAGVDQAKDGSLVAVGRGDAIDGHLALSISRDMGKSWAYFATPFPPVSYGQRPVLRRLRDGNLLLVSFAPAMEIHQPGSGPTTGQGMFAALSTDGGKTWPFCRFLTDGKRRALDGQGMTKKFVMDATHAEPAGYLAAIETPDDMIQLISSGLHYRFNEAWLRM